MQKICRYLVTVFLLAAHALQADPHQIHGRHSFIYPAVEEGKFHIYPGTEWNFETLPQEEKSIFNVVLTQGEEQVFLIVLPYKLLMEFQDVTEEECLSELIAQMKFALSQSDNLAIAYPKREGNIARLIDEKAGQDLFSINIEETYLIGIAWVYGEDDLHREERFRELLALFAFEYEGELVFIRDYIESIKA